MIELNLRNSAPQRRPKPPPQRYFGSVGAEATVCDVSGQQQRAQYAWALANMSGSELQAPHGLDSKGAVIKKKRKKTRSKQKNLKKDTRSAERRPGGSAHEPARKPEPDLPPLDALLVQLQRENPRMGPKRLTTLVRASHPELAKGTKQVRQAIARMQRTKRKSGPLAEDDEIDHGGQRSKPDSAPPVRIPEDAYYDEDDDFSSAHVDYGEYAAAGQASVEAAVAAAEIWARERNSSSSSSSSDEEDKLERDIVSAWSGGGQRGSYLGDSGVDDGSSDEKEDFGSWWSLPEFEKGGADHCSCRLPQPKGGGGMASSCCCICGGIGHSRFECTASPTKMPAENDDYFKIPYSQMRGQRGWKRKSGESGKHDDRGTKRTKRKRGAGETLYQQIQAASQIPTNGKRARASAEKKKISKRREDALEKRSTMKSGKAREEGARPKSGWAPKPKRTVFGGKKKKGRGGGGGAAESAAGFQGKRAVKQQRFKHKAERGGGGGGGSRKFGGR